MASYTRREVTIRHIEYLVPSGDPIVEWDKAATNALREWESLHPGQTPMDDWATVHTHDEHVIIRIEVREVADRV